VTVDTVAVHRTDYFINGQVQMLRARSIAQKRHCESQGFDKNREFKEWVASNGAVSCGSEVRRLQSYRRVTFGDQPQLFENVEGNAEGGAVSTPPFTEEVLINSEWGIDDDVSSHPSIDHRERLTWRLAPSRILIRPTEKRYRVSYDMDLPPFLAGADASSEEEEDYLDDNLDGELIDGEKLEAPEADDDLIMNTPDDRPGQVHTTETYKVHLAAEHQDCNVNPGF